MAYCDYPTGYSESWYIELMKVAIKPETAKKIITTMT
jgi:hypothetical protein